MKYEAQDEQRQAFYWQEYQSERTPDYVSYDQGQFSPTPSLDGAVIGAILSYSLGWFTGLIFYLFGRNHPYVRFHALQSLLFFGAINIADVALFNIIDALTRFHLFPFLSSFAILLFLFLNFVAFIGWAVGMIQAARGKYYRLPLVGHLPVK
ncbi:MAG TPA: hypothetical protein VFA09_07470 [Ktedonobacteraceae bacterium]|jgi:uncharacterized membrane protein|nr:hypothetical protein [Ktedonobacteraceae bacterium]